jgi:hypothetical protein
MTQLFAIQEAIEVVLRDLEGLPPSDTTEEFCTRLQDCAQDTVMWGASRPTQRELDVLLRRVLALHVDVTNAERGASLARGGRRVKYAHGFEPRPPVPFPEAP